MKADLGIVEPRSTFGEFRRRIRFRVGDDGRAFVVAYQDRKRTDWFTSDAFRGVFPQLFDALDAEAQAWAVRHGYAKAAA